VAKRQLLGGYPKQNDLDAIITDGLDPGEIIVAKNEKAFKEGLKVKPQE